MRICLIVLIALALGACSPSLVALPEPTQMPPAAELEKSPTEASSNTDELIGLAIADLSTRFSLDPAAVRVLSIESQIWPDSALGCPRPGESYTQQTVPGYRLRLEANGQIYEYQSDKDEKVTRCGLLLDDNSVKNDTKGTMDDGWPNETKDQDVIIKITPSKQP